MLLVRLLAVAGGAAPALRRAGHSVAWFEPEQINELLDYQPLAASERINYRMPSLALLRVRASYYENRLTPLQPLQPEHQEPKQSKHNHATGRFLCAAFPR